MYKFKIGDKVRIKKIIGSKENSFTREEEEWINNLLIGKTGIITKIDFDNGYLYPYKIDRIYTSPDNTDFEFFRAKELELVPVVPKEQEIALKVDQLWKRSVYYKEYVKST